VQLEPTPPQRQAALESARDTFQTGASQFQLGGDGPTALEAAARLCQEQDLPFVLVIMPEGPTFRSWYRDGAESELRAGIQALANRWNAHVIDCWDSLPEEAFIDSHHLLARAAGGFTTDLARKSLAPLEQAEMTPRISTRNVRTENR
jgi:hypothetical protein